MDRELEEQLTRVIGLFRSAANKRWGKEERSKNWSPPPPDATKNEAVRELTTKAINARGWVKGSETPIQKLAREYFELHPEATSREASNATGVSRTVCKAVKAKLAAKCGIQRPHDKIPVGAACGGGSCEGH